MFDAISPDICIIRGKNTFAEGSGSFVNKGKYTEKMFTWHHVVENIHILDIRSAPS